MSDPEESAYGAAGRPITTELFPEVAEGMIDRLEELARSVVEFSNWRSGPAGQRCPSLAEGLMCAASIFPEMVEQMRRKPGGAAVDVTIGDFADVGC